MAEAASCPRVFNQFDGSGIVRDKRLDSVPTERLDSSQESVWRKVLPCERAMMKTQRS